MKTDRFNRVTVSNSMPNERLDHFLKSEFPIVSRGTLQRLIAEGHIKVDGKSVKPTHKPRAGEVIDVFWPEPRTDKAEPEEIPLAVMYEDEHLLVINKAPGMVVHPASGSESHTLVNALLHHCKGQLSGIGGVARPGIVHRLDKETSGCLIAAKNDLAHVHLSDQFKQRSVEKIYHLIAYGRVHPARGEIRAAIARHPDHRKQMAVREKEGRPAHTGYRVLEQWKFAALVEAYLHTGRTHQIRVHFKHIRFSLIGDQTYGKKSNHHFQQRTGIVAHRQMLHAHRLSVTHPVSGERMTFEAEWPQDFVTIVEACR